jgi:hypothetical protein
MQEKLEKRINNVLESLEKIASLKKVGKITP